MDRLTQFCAAIADLLEVDSIGPDDDFRQVDGWCSLRAFAILVALENEWHAPISVERFQTLKTVRDLYGEI